jgi:cysteine-rich repeat protein
VATVSVPSERLAVHAAAMTSSRCPAGRTIDPEECDDGNKDDGDGCSSTCIIEEKFYCVGGNRFGPDQCRSLNTSLWFRRQDEGHDYGNMSWFRESAERLLIDGSSHQGADSDQRRDTDPGPRMLGEDFPQRANDTRRQYAGSIVVSLNIEFNSANANQGNKTIYIRHLHQALKHPDFLRRFQEAMREQDTPVVVAWTEYVLPSKNFFPVARCVT